MLSEMYVCGRQLYLSRSLSGRWASTNKGTGNSSEDLLPVFSPRRRDVRKSTTTAGLLLFVLVLCTVCGVLGFSSLFSSRTHTLEPHRPQIERLSPLPVFPAGKEVSWSLKIPTPATLSDSETSRLLQMKASQVTHSNSRRSQGEAYYYNVKTKESQWKHPEVDTWKIVVTGIGSLDKERYFYQNLRTGDVSWVRPPSYDWAAAFARTRSEL